MNDLLSTLAALGFIVALWWVAPAVYRRNQRQPRDYSNEREEP